MEGEKSPNDHLILHLKLFDKIAHAELGAEDQRYRGKRNLPTQMQNSPTKVIRIQVFREMVMIFRAIRTFNWPLHVTYKNVPVI